MKKVIVLVGAAMFLALPMIASANLVGQCSDCHTMHNSEQGSNVAVIADGTVSEQPLQNLLKLDCIACHTDVDPGAGITDGIKTLSGGSKVPLVSHSSAVDLAGGNFRYSTADQRKGHNVIDLTPADASNATQVEGGATIFGAPPGNAHADHHDESSGVFTTTGGSAFDAFTCAGARGCHGTRSQLLSGDTVDNGTANVFQGVRRTGIAAISGAHHNSFDGAKTDLGYTGAAVHDGSIVAAGYRFIPGLNAYGNETPGDRWENKDASSHNEYFATEGNTLGASAGCGDCHNQGTVQGLSARATFDSNMPVPGNDMSGFCGTCHGVFHSAGTENGTSGAFLRHPSDWVIPAGTTEYSAYTVYDVTAPVARPLVATAVDAAVHPGTDMVMCLSCHAAHATQYDYMLRGDYTTMVSGEEANAGAAQAEGFCQACHTEKGVM